jgi:phytoene synthase
MSLESAISYEEALENCRSALRQGSKSFSLAARLFNRDIQNAVMSLYGWCRHCDDEIDGSTLGFQNSSPALQNNQASDRLARLKDLTQRAYSGEPMTHPVFVAFQHVVKKYDIPLFYPMELLEGMGMDDRTDFSQRLVHKILEHVEANREQFIEVWMVYHEK